MRRALTVVSGFLLIILTAMVSNVKTRSLKDNADILADEPSDRTATLRTA